MKRFTCLLVAATLLSCSSVEIHTPEAFAPLDTHGQHSAMSPEGMLYRIRFLENTPEQGLDFWAQALACHLRERGYMGDSSSTTFQAGEAPGVYAEWSVPYGNDTYRYLTGILVSDKTVVIRVPATAFRIVFSGSWSSAKFSTRQSGPTM